MPCYKLIQNREIIIIINVYYFPCSRQDADYLNKLSECLGCVEDVLTSNVFTDVAILGDTNFLCDE